MVRLVAEILGTAPTLAKILAVLPLFARNYLGQRSIVFDGRPSAAMALVAERARALTLRVT
jgi:hypothetical protein